MIDFEQLLSLLIYNPEERLLFNSGFFLFFLLFFFIGYFALRNKSKARVAFVSLFSLYFFYKACGWYVGLVIVAAVVDFNLSIIIYKSRNIVKRKGLLIFSLIINLGLLCYFKYTDFFIEIINDFQKSQIKPLQLILPVGISFYTFENISYTIDIYRRSCKPVKHFMDYLFFLSFFPKLMMGPIVRAADFIPQIRKKIWLTNEDVAKGFFLIVSGCIKKVIISDYLSTHLVNAVFDDPLRYSGVECLFAVYGYALVIYCDFSGYSDMAIGIAKWMGIDVNINFNAPYQSRSITEFWRKWHISLSSWLRDYLYISMGGNRKGKIRTYTNLIITMVIGGFWHGASWNFLLWGAAHGVILAAEKLWIDNNKRSSKSNNWIKSTLQVILTFHIVCALWIFFKAETFDQAIMMFKQLVYNLDFSVLPEFVIAYQTTLLLIIGGFILHATPIKWNDVTINVLSKMHWSFKTLILTSTLIALYYFNSAGQVLPIYLQF
jgi:D-alanyl-lipoteichoic acid acyltransferase DltB (MBOAT superfamily)